MNNVTRFPSFIEYPDLDTSILRQSAGDAGQAGIEVRRLFIQTDYLPSLHSRVIGVDDAMRDAVFKLREVALSTNTKLLINTKTLKEYQAELASAGDTDRQEILEDIGSQAAKVVKAVSQGHATLQQLLVPMTQPIDRVATRQYLVQLEAEQQRLPAEILEIQERMTALAQKRQTLTEAMALIEGKSFAQVGKDTMLNAQEIAKLGMAGPEVAVVEKAIELAQQLMERLENLINYFGLMDARNVIRKQMDDLLASTYDKTAELRICGMKRDFIAACHSFDDHRDLYIAEFRKIIAAKQSFIDVYRSADTTDESTVSELVSDALALSGYLKVLA